MNPRDNGIIFDLGNVIIQLDFSDSLKHLASLTRLDPEVLLEILRHDPVHAEYEKGEISTGDFLARFSRMIPAKISREVLVDIYCGIFTKILTGRPLLKDLSRRHNLYILSNTNELHFEYLKEHYHVWDLFDGMFLSFQLRMTKPDPGIYETLIRRVPQDRDQLVFIDDLEENVRGAKKSGIDGILFRSVDSMVEQLSQRGLL